MKRGGNAVRGDPQQVEHPPPAPEFGDGALGRGAKPGEGGPGLLLPGIGSRALWAFEGSAHSAGGALVAGVCGGLHIGVRVGDGPGDAVGASRSQVVGRSRARGAEQEQFAAGGAEPHAGCPGAVDGSFSGARSCARLTTAAGAPSTSGYGAHDLLDRLQRGPRVREDEPGDGFLLPVPLPVCRCHGGAPARVRRADLHPAAGTSRRPTTGMFRDGLRPVEAACAGGTTHGSRRQPDASPRVAGRGRPETVGQGQKRFSARRGRILARRAARCARRRRTCAPA